MSWCDLCGKEWEASFFCKTCCDTPELEEVAVPLLSGIEWDYTGNDWDYEMQEVYYTVCLNCCPGHATSTAKQGAAD